MLYISAFHFARQLSTLEGFGASSRLVTDFAYRWFPSQIPVFTSGIGLFFVIKDKVKWWWLILGYLPGALLVVLAHRLDPNTGIVPLVAVAIMLFVAAVARWSPHLIVNRFTAFL